MRPNINTQENRKQRSSLIVWMIFFHFSKLIKVSALCLPGPRHFCYNLSSVCKNVFNLEKYLKTIFSMKVEGTDCCVWRDENIIIGKIEGKLAKKYLQWWHLLPVLPIIYLGGGGGGRHKFFFLTATLAYTYLFDTIFGSHLTGAQNCM